MTTPTTRPATTSARGFTLLEMLVIIALIAALVGIMVPALGILRKNALLVSSQSNARTVGTLLASYSADNRDHVVPSQFDYSATSTAGTVRSASPEGVQPPTGGLRRGSWADILWTTAGLGPLVPSNSDDAEVPSPTWDYRFDSPDFWAYRSEGVVSWNPLRSEGELRKSLPYDVTEPARPFGKGASIREQGQPGYFAANDFFNARPDASGTSNWFTNAMIRVPSTAVYLVDSRAGETIPLPSQANVVAFNGQNAANPEAWTPSSVNCEVEFRYVGDVCCMLYMDSHVVTMGKWANLNELRQSRQTRVEQLDRQ